MNTCYVVGMPNKLFYSIQLDLFGKIKIMLNEGHVGFILGFENQAGFYVSVVW